MLLAATGIWFHLIPGTDRVAPDDPKEINQSATNNQEPKDKVKPNAIQAVPMAMPAYLKGRLPHQKFDLKVELLGSKLSAKDQRHLLRVGDLISFRLTAAQDCHVGIWNVTATRVIQLFPNDIDMDNRLQAGQSRVLLGSRPKVRAKKPSGLEYLHVVAATKPLRPIDAPVLRAGEDGVFSIFASSEANDRCRIVLRELQLVNEGAAVSEVIVPFEVRP